MAFTASEQEGVFIVDVFGTEQRGELLLPVQQLLADRRRTPSAPIILNRTRLESSAVELTELLEFLLFVERNRSQFVNGHLYLVHQPRAHPQHLRDMFKATAAVRSLKFFHICDTLEDALRELRSKR